MPGLRAAAIPTGSNLKFLFDVTTTARSACDPPVGTTRVDRTVLCDLYRELGPGRLTFVKWDRGRLMGLTKAESATLQLLIESPAQQASRPSEPADPHPASSRPVVRKSITRRIARAIIELYPEPYRQRAFDAALQTHDGLGALGRVSMAALRARQVQPASPAPDLSLIERPSHPQEDFSGHTDLITLGNGWDYLNYEDLHRLRARHGIRIHGFVHDLIAVEYPYFFHDPARASVIHRHYAELCHACETLICNSFATRAALLDFITHEHLPLPRIVVAQLPVFASDTLTPAPPPEVADGPFVLFVSTLEVRKNHRLLLNLWRECLREDKPMPRLVLVGRVGWGVATVLEMIEHDPFLQGRVTILHDIGDAQLAWLYDSCLFTVYPSIAEGWGLPIGEALGRGRICLHATDPAQSEAAQNLMPALHPEDFYGWKAAILDLIDRPARRARLEATIRERFVPITRAQFCATVRDAIGL